MAGELLAFPHGIAGLALSLEEDQVGAVILGDYTELSEGDEVKRTGKILSRARGRRHDRPRGQRARVSPSTTRAPSPDKSLPVERLAPGIIDRQPCASPWPPASRPSTP
jgi:F-type H+-transporting ATPase subunit alpha